VKVWKVTYVVIGNITKEIGVIADDMASAIELFGWSVHGPEIAIRAIELVLEDVIWESDFSPTMDE